MAAPIRAHRIYLDIRRTLDRLTRMSPAGRVSSQLLQGLLEGQLEYYERWEDLRFPFSRDKQGQTQKPDYDYTNMGLLFPQNDPTEIVYIIAQMSHKMLVGSNFIPHIHFIQSVADQPTFKLDYRWVKQGDDDALKSFITITASTFTFAWVSGDLLQVAVFPEIDGSDVMDISSFLDIKIYRDDNVVTGDVLAKEFDFHYKVDGNGSEFELVKGDVD